MKTLSESICHKCTCAKQRKQHLYNIKIITRFRPAHLWPCKLYSFPLETCFKWQQLHMSFLDNYKYQSHIFYFLESVFETNSFLLQVKNRFFFPVSSAFSSGLCKIWNQLEDRFVNCGLNQSINSYSYKVIFYKLPKSLSLQRCKYNNGCLRLLYFTSSVCKHVQIARESFHCSNSSLFIVLGRGSFF